MGLTTKLTFPLPGGGGSSFSLPYTGSAGTLTTNVKVLDLSVTWNAAGVTFTGIKLNATSTASAAASLLMDLQVGGTSMMNVGKDGAIYGGKDGAASACTFARLGQANTGMYFPGTNQVGLVANGVGCFTASSFEIGLPLKVALGGASVSYILQDVANTQPIAIRNGTNAQIFRIYNTYTDGSNYQRLEHNWNTSTALIMNQGAGTGADGNIAFNDAALATNATKGYIMIPSCAGAPTGVPADIPTGQIALHYDSTNNKLYAYNGAWKSTAALT